MWNAFPSVISGVLSSISSTISSWASSIASTISNILSSITSAEASATAGAIGGGGGSDISIGANATGGIYSVTGGGGGADSLNLRGQVSPGEIVAVIPPNTASASLLTALQGTIGNSPISVSPNGMSGTSIDALAVSDSQAAANTATSMISAPTSYAALESAGGAYGMGGAATASSGATRTTGARAARSAYNPFGNNMYLPGVTGVDWSNVQYINGGAHPLYTYGAGGRTAGGGGGGGVSSQVKGLPGDLNSELDALSNMHSNTPWGFMGDTGGGGGGSAAATSRRAGSGGTPPQQQQYTSGHGYSNPTRVGGGGSTPVINPFANPWDISAAQRGSDIVSNMAGLPGAPDVSRAAAASDAFGAGASPASNYGFGDIFGTGQGLANELGLGTTSGAFDSGLGIAAAMGMDVPDWVAASMLNPGDAGADPFASATNFGSADPFDTASADFSQTMGDIASSYSDFSDMAPPDISSMMGGSIDPDLIDYTMGSDTGFAAGGSFSVPYTGRAGADTVPTRLNLTPGENVQIGNGGGGMDDHRVGGYGNGAGAKGGGDNHFHFYGVQDMKGFNQSRTAMARWAARSLGG